MATSFPLGRRFSPSEILDALHSGGWRSPGSLARMLALSLHEAAACEETLTVELATIQSVPPGSVVLDIAGSLAPELLRSRRLLDVRMPLTGQCRDARGRVAQVPASSMVVRLFRLGLFQVPASPAEFLDPEVSGRLLRAGSCARAAASLGWTEDAEWFARTQPSWDARGEEALRHVSEWTPPSGTFSGGAS